MPLETSPELLNETTTDDVVELDSVDSKFPYTGARWQGIVRNYTYKDVLKLRGSVRIEHTLATLGAQRLWKLMNEQSYVNALGALTGNQAVQQVRAGLQAIYLSGWQVAADANLSGHMYPDQSLYPANSVPMVVKRINQALQRADQIEHAEGNVERNWFAPIVADAEAGFGGPLNAFELMKQMIEAGAAAVHFEDQLSSEKKCGHLGGKVLVPTSQFIKTLTSARLAADVMGVPTILIARTDANSAKLMTNDIDPLDEPFITSRERTPEGFFRLGGTGLDAGGGGHFIDGAVDKIDSLLAIGIGGSGKVHFNHQQFLRCIARLHALEMIETLDQQSRADEQDQGKRDLGDREPVAEVVVRSIAREPVGAFAQGVAEIGLGRLEGGNESEERSRDDGNHQREYQHPPVHVDHARARNCPGAELQNELGPPPSKR